MAAGAFERIYTLDELATAERCVVCDAPADTSIPLEPAAGVALGSDADRVSRHSLRACHACAQAQADARRFCLRVSIAIYAIAPFVGAAIAALTPRASFLVGPIACAGAWLGAGAVIRYTIDRARARRIRALVLEVEGDRVLLQIARVAATTAMPAGYRSAGRPVEDVAEPVLVSPRPPTAPRGLFAIASLFVCALVGVTAWSGAFEHTHALVIDSPSDHVVVSIGGEHFEVAAGGRATVVMGPGTYPYRVDYTQSRDFVTGTITLSAWDDTLISTDPTQCYYVWLRHRSPVDTHENGRVRWASVDDAKGANRIPCR